MYGFAEFHILSSVFAAVFAGATAARLFGGKAAETAAVFAGAAAVLKTVDSVFAPRGIALAYGAAIGCAALVAARRRKPGAAVGAAAAITLTFASASVFDAAVAEASGGLYPVFSFVEAPVFAAVYAVVRAVAAKVLSCRVRRAYGASAQLTVGGKSVEVAAFWDSGNTLTFRGLSPVVVLDGRVSNVLEGARVAGAMTVSGACGTRGSVAYYLDSLKVRDGDGERTYADVVAVAVDRNFDGFDVLLNCGLS